MEKNLKFTTLLELLVEKDFAHVSSLWSTFNNEEKSEFKFKIIGNLSEENIIDIYNSFCFINKNLAEEIVGIPSIEKKINKIKKNNTKIKVNKGKEIENLENNIKLKVEHLNVFKIKLEEKGFKQNLIDLLTLQELVYLNNFSLMEKGDGKA